MILSYMEKAHDSSSFSKTCDQNLWIRRQSSQAKEKNTNKRLNTKRKSQKNTFLKESPGCYKLLNCICLQFKSNKCAGGVSINVPPKLSNVLVKLSSCLCSLKLINASLKEVDKTISLVKRIKVKLIHK